MKNQIADENNNAKRESNIELLRIITILLIIMHHYCRNAGFEQFFNNDHISASMLIVQFLSFGGKTGINIFLLITGYFMCKSQFNPKKILSLLFEYVFYSISITLFLYCFGFIELDRDAVIKMFFPYIVKAGSEFFATYLILYCLMPFLNILIKYLTKKQHIILISVLLFYFTFIPIFTILPTILYHDTWNYLGWMVTVYFIGAYIRIYQPKFLRRYKRNGYLTLACIVLMWASCLYFDLRYHQYYYFYTENANKFLPIACAVFMFSYFADLKIRSNQFINYISASTFGVYLIHSQASNVYMSHLIWVILFKNIVFFNTPLLIFHCFISVFIVFIICTAIDIFRRNTFAKIGKFIIYIHYEKYVSKNYKNT